MIDKNKITTLDSLDTILPAFENKIVEKYFNKNNYEPCDNDIPVIYITGDVPTKKLYVRATLKYESKTHNFTSYIKYKLQGNYTMTLPKKNFTIKLFEDEARTLPKYKNFKNWGNLNKFVFKADHDDITHTRNLVGARLWSKVVASRPDYLNLPEEMRNTPNNCAIDGFPAIVYINNAYYGVYNITIPKGPLMFGMDKKNENHVALQAEINDGDGSSLWENPCNFNQAWDGREIFWSYEMGKNAEESFNKLYQYIYATPDKTSLMNYMDIQSAIDYYIFQSVIFNVDGLAKNMILLTYDKIKWYLSAYDMDNTFGSNGSLSYNPEKDYNGLFTAMPGSSAFINLDSALWPFLTTNFSQEVQDRYLELRSGVLSYQSIINEFENYMKLCNEDLCIQDTIVFPSIPHVDYNNINTLRLFIKNRLAGVDQVILGRVLNV